MPHVSNSMYERQPANIKTSALPLSGKVCCTMSVLHNNLARLVLPRIKAIRGSQCHRRSSLSSDA